LRHSPESFPTRFGTDWTAVILLTLAGLAAAGLAVISVLAARTPDLHLALMPIGISLLVALLAVWASKMLVEEAQRRAQEQQEMWKLKSELAISQRLREFHHDLVNHLTTVSMLIQIGAGDRAVKYLHEILRSTRPSAETAANTESHTVTLLLGMLGQKFARAEQENISLKVELGSGWNPVAVPDDVAVRLLGNLIDNALDAAALANGGGSNGSKSNEKGGGGKVEVSVTADRPTVRFRVWNNGPPIPRSDLQRIFKPGETTKGGSHQGLGLSIVRRLVDEHGGTITVNSSAEKGTEFIAEFREPCD